MERSESVDNTCPVCHEIIDIYAVGPCDHPICYRCSTRMRVLCEQQDCPICRSTMPQVALVHQKAAFKDIDLRNCIPNRKNKMFYADEQVENKYLDLLEFRCRLCPSRKPDRNFSSLQTHMRREHLLFACDLCLDHLMIFPFERKFYDRKSLATHRRIGDADDKSYKGHPLCEFCDKRYNDKDELLKHLRKDHYFCHFCDTQGSNAYYDQYPDLKKHFSESHFLCTEGECGLPDTQFTHAFASEIDLKAHKATAHNKNMSRAQTREARTLEVGFHVAPRRQGHGRSRDDVGNSYHGQGADNYHRRHTREDVDLQRAIAASRETMTAPVQPVVQEKLPDPVHDFPTLNGATVPLTYTRDVEKKPKEEDFPSLSSAGRTTGKESKQQSALKPYASVMNHQTQVKPVAKPKKSESKPVSLGVVPSASKDRWVGPVPDFDDDSYPVLGKSSRNFSNLTASNGGWYQSFQSKSEAENVVNSNVSIVPSKSVESERSESKKKNVFTLQQDVSNDNEFPSLGGGARPRDDSALNNPMWPRQNNKKKSAPVAQKNQKKVGDALFQLPDSYYTAYDVDGPQEKDDVQENSLSSVFKGKAQISSAKPDISHPNEFPGLPVTTRKADRPEEKKKKVKSKPKKQPNTNPDVKKAEENNASLNDIAFTLMGPGIIEHSKENVKVSQKQKQPKEAKKINGFAESIRSLDPKQESNNNRQSDKRVPESSGKQLKSVAKSEKMAEDSPMDFTSSKTKEEQFVDNSFPSLHAMSTPFQSTRPPPGFIPDPPPSRAAPPGFSSVPVHTQPPASKPPQRSEYVQPPDFKPRNLELIQEVKSCLENIEDGFVNFKTLSGQFRQGVLEASDYFFSCQSLMGEVKFSKMFRELLSLLPDIEKQQELWKICQVVDQSNPTLETTKDLLVCPVCSQVILNQDVAHHQNHHEVEHSDFPALQGAGAKKLATTASHRGVAVKGSWIIAK